MLEDFTLQQEQDALASFSETNISANRGMAVRNPFHPKREVDVAGLVRQSSRRCVSQCRGRDTCKLVTFVRSKEKPVKQIAAFTLLVVLSFVSSMPVKAQSSGVKEYARQSQIAAKKQQKLQKKAANKQRKAIKKY